MGENDLCGPSAVFFLCRKFMTVWHGLVDTDAICGDDDLGEAHVTRLYSWGSRLFSTGDNWLGTAGTGCCDSFDRGLAWIRLPPVRAAYRRVWAWLVDTSRGSYAWGMNAGGRLGVGSAEYTVDRPALVPLPCPLISADAESDFILTAGGWMVAGENTFGQLALPDADPAPRPTHVPVPDVGVTVTSWLTHHWVTFAWTDGGLMACGHNACGQCGVGSPEGRVASLTPVMLPPDVKGRVTKVAHSQSATLIVAGGRCFSCGSTQHGELGLTRPQLLEADPAMGDVYASDDGHPYGACAQTPVEVRLGVTDCAVCDGLTLMLSDGTIYVCGDNSTGCLSPDLPDDVVTPLSLPLPPGVTPTRAVVGPGRVYVRSPGGWLGRGGGEGWVAIRDERRVAGLEAALLSTVVHIEG